MTILPILRIQAASCQRSPCTGKASSGNELFLKACVRMLWGWLAGCVAAQLPSLTFNSYWNSPEWMVVLCVALRSKCHFCKHLEVDLERVSEVFGHQQNISFRKIIVQPGTIQSIFASYICKVYALPQLVILRKGRYYDQYTSERTVELISDWITEKTGMEAMKNYSRLIPIENMNTTIFDKLSEGACIYAAVYHSVIPYAVRVASDGFMNDDEIVPISIQIDRNEDIRRDFEITWAPSLLVMGARGYNIVNVSDASPESIATVVDDICRNYQIHELHEFVGAVMDGTIPDVVPRPFDNLADFSVLQDFFITRRAMTLEQLDFYIARYRAKFRTRLALGYTDEALVYKIHAMMALRSIKRMENANVPDPIENFVM